MKLKEFIKQIAAQDFDGSVPDAKEFFAGEIGTTAGYLDHLIYERRTPREGLLKKIIVASRGQVALNDFFPDVVKLESQHQG